MIKKVAPEQQQEPVYFKCARFIRLPIGFPFVEIKADEMNIIGPRLATPQDIEMFPEAWADYQAKYPDAKVQE